MPDARLIKKKICVDNKIAKLSMQSAFIFTWMILFTDREGKMVANPEILKGSAFPFIKELSVEKISKSLIEIESVGLIVRYKIDEVEYCKFPSFTKNHAPTALAKEAPSVIPEPNGNEIKTDLKLTQELLESKERPLSSDFEECYSAYPRKEGKAQALKHWNAHPRKKEDMLKAIANYEKDLNKRYSDPIERKKFTQTAGRFFFESWEDWIESEEDRKKKAEDEREKRLEKEMADKKAKFYAENPEFKQEEK